MYDDAFSNIANHQIRHQAAHIVGCQPGNAYGHFNLPGGGGGGITYGLT